MVSVKIKVIPKSGRQEVVSDNGQLKVRLKSLPEKGKANDELIRILAKFLDVSQSEIRIIRGLSSKNKTVEISGITSEELGEMLGIAASNT